MGFFKKMRDSMAESSRQAREVALKECAAGNHKFYDSERFTSRANPAGMYKRSACGVCGKIEWECDNGYSGWRRVGDEEAARLEAERKNVAPF